MSLEKYAFIKNNIVVNIAIFDNPTKELLDFFKNEHDLDNIIPITKSSEIGGTYDGENFWKIQPFSSWIKDYTANEWESPIPYPNDGKSYIWNEEILNWEEVVAEE